MYISKQNTWYSGDWSDSGNNPQPPYNGVQITAIATYSAVGSPPLPTGKLVSVDLTVTDYTYDPNGISSSVTINKGGVWIPIPIPIDNTVSPPILNPLFTVMGINGTGPGVVRLDSHPSGTFLNIQFRYGLENMTREEIGYIMRFDPSTDSTTVEG